ncbi:MAG: cell division protein FtsQ [Bacteriovoracaceae bacterium]|nr:cell division protein FtsQ [Bacteriovoracaceae bacterium]
MRKIHKTILIFCLLPASYLIIDVAVSSLGPSKSKQKLKYRTSFGRCPARAAGNMTMKMIKNFESFGSLKKLKQQILEENLQQKHFLSSYRIKYDPLKKFLNLKFQCPVPLMKVQIFKKDGMDSYDAILVDNSELYDPTYEELLRNEKKLAHDLPYLALPIESINSGIRQKITNLFKKMSEDFAKKLSEIIYSDEKELTIILSINGKPSSVFMGHDEWKVKLDKLHKIVNYMELKKKMPVVINLTNTKKVVVKFNNKF